MAENWKAPGAEEVKIKYDLIQFSTGEWAIRQTEIKYIAWFPTRYAAASVCNTLLPLNAERDI